MSEQESSPNLQGQSEIDDKASLFDLVLLVLKNGRLLLVLTVLFGMLGLFIAITAEAEYTTSATLICESETDQSMSGMGNLSLLRGLGLNLGSGSMGLTAETYPDILSSAGLWSTIGNHEMGVSGLSTATSTGLYLPAQGQRDPLPASPMPYLNIHTLPTQGENGGEPSNTEQYYSFDYGNVHVVSLDSQVAIRDSGNNETMKQWLINDLSASSNDWTLVIFHHPPYTKGSHDSDSAVLGIDQPIFDIREQYTEIFEDHGVDLAYSGHSHSYERSFYLNGHTGLEASFDPNVHAEHDGAGNPLTGQDDQEYRQISNNSGVDDKVVYTVAGSSGQATSTSDGYPHNAMAYSEIVLGSVVIDATATTLTARFINIDGDVLDFFVINR